MNVQVSAQTRCIPGAKVKVDVQIYKHQGQFLWVKAVSRLAPS